jgi:hypothetical protein
MMRMKDEVLLVDMILAVSEQLLLGFLNDEIVNPKGEFHYNGKLNKPVWSSW